ncbi:MAG: hypothetical protein HZA81_04285 [Candidatus Taylorbacteria bacterium]|nr:hypothetical protein [Candidatus Taylorbacteria bacterium]
MSKKTFTILVIAVLAIFAIVGWYIWNRSSSNIPEETGENVQGGLFPGGTGSQGGATGGTGEGEEGDEGLVIDLGGGSSSEKPRLRQLSTSPSAGVVAFDKGETVFMRYVERATGHIYETSDETTSSTKISNTTLPKIHEALWSKDGSKLLIRYLKDGIVRTFYAQLSTSSPEAALEGLFLQDGISSVSVQGNRAFYLDETGAGAQGIVSEMNGSKKTVVFSSTFGDWDAVWSSPKAITLYSRPSGKSGGSAYLLDSATGAYTKVIGGTLGLRPLGNVDGSFVFYSGSDGADGLASAVADVKEENSFGVGVSTLSDKCVWSAKEKVSIYCAVPRFIESGLYPDDWYKGRISFEDSFWKINVSTGVTEEIFNPLSEAGVSMDIFDLSLDEKETMLVFRNKRDMTPWAYALVP